MNPRSIRPPVHTRSVLARPALALLVLAITPPLQAQDPAKVSPDMYKCTFENEHARLCEVTVPAGARIPSHSHPQHLVYVLEPGKARISPTAGEAAEVDFTTGQTLWIPAETHHAENIGDTEVKLLVIEFKALKTNAPMKDMPMKDMPMKDKLKQEAQKE